MGVSIADRSPARPRELPEMRPVMAKADVRKPENETDRREKVGKAFAQACEPWSLGELSQMLKRDERQIARWKSGAERVQLDAVLGDERLWARFVVAQAQMKPSVVEVETVLRVRSA
jgi:hypothetical protein